MPRLLTEKEVDTKIKTAIEDVMKNITKSNTLMMSKYHSGFRTVTVSDTAPVSPALNDLWIDTSN